MPVVKHVTKRQKKCKKSHSGANASKKDKNKNAGRKKACAAPSFTQQNPKPIGVYGKASAAAVEKPLTRSEIPSRVNDDLFEVGTSAWRLRIALRHNLILVAFVALIPVIILGRRGRTWPPVRDMPPHKNRRISGDSSKNSGCQATPYNCNTTTCYSQDQNREQREYRGRQPAKLALGHFIRIENFAKIQEVFEKARERQLKKMQARTEQQEKAAAAAGPATTEISSQGAGLVAAAPPASPEISSQAAAPGADPVAVPESLSAATRRVIRMDPGPLTVEWCSDACYYWRQPFKIDFPTADQDPIVKPPERGDGQLNPIGYEILLAKRQRLALMGGGQSQEQEEQNALEPDPVTRVLDISELAYRPGATDSLVESIRKILGESNEPDGFWGPRTVWSWDNHLPEPVLTPGFFPPLSATEIRGQLSRPPVQVPQSLLTSKALEMTDNQIQVQEPTYQSFQVPEPEPEQESHQPQVFQSVPPPTTNNPLAGNSRFYPNNFRGQDRGRGGQHQRCQNWQQGRQYQNNNNQNGVQNNQYQQYSNNQNNQHQQWLQNSNTTNSEEPFSGRMSIGLPPPVYNCNQNMSYAHPMGYSDNQGASFVPPFNPNNPANNLVLPPTNSTNGHAQHHQQQAQQENSGMTKGKKGSALGMVGWVIGGSAGGSPAGGSLAAAMAARKARFRTYSRDVSCPRTPPSVSSTTAELPSFKLNKANFPPLPVPLKKRINEAGQ